MNPGRRIVEEGLLVICGFVLVFLFVKQREGWGIRNGVM